MEMSESNKKVCSVCKEEKLLSEYQDCGNWAFCSECNRERSKRYYHAHKEQKNAARKPNICRSRNEKSKSTVGGAICGQLDSSPGAHPDFCVVLVKPERTNKAFKLEQSTWRIKGNTHDFSEILKEIKMFSSKIAERYLLSSITQSVRSSAFYHCMRQTGITSRRQNFRSKQLITIPLQIGG